MRVTKNDQKTNDGVKNGIVLSKIQKLTFPVTHSGYNGDNGEERSCCTERVSRDADGFCVTRLCDGRGDSGRRGSRFSCRNEGRFSVSDCWKSWAKGGREAVEGWGSWGAEGTLPLPLLPLLCFQALVLFVLSQIDFGSARSVVPSLL